MSRRTFEALIFPAMTRSAFYDNGVGTSSFKPWAIGRAFGLGLRRNVIALYKFAGPTIAAPTTNCLVLD